MNATEFAAKVEADFRKQFPNGFFKVSRASLGKETIFLAFGLIKDIEDCPSKIRGNDPMFTTMVIHDATESDLETMRERVKVELSQGGRIDVNPPAGSYLAMTGVKFGFRATTNSPEKVAASLGKFWAKARGIVDENKANIYGVDRIKPEYV